VDTGTTSANPYGRVGASSADLDQAIEKCAVLLAIADDLDDALAAGQRPRVGRRIGLTPIHVARRSILKSMLPTESGGTPRGDLHGNVLEFAQHCG
jgi:hypothetical protein